MFLCANLISTPAQKYKKKLNCCDSCSEMINFKLKFYRGYVSYDSFQIRVESY